MTSETQALTQHYWDYIGIMEPKMETTIIGYVRYIYIYTGVILLQYTIIRY